MCCFWFLNGLLCDQRGEGEDLEPLFVYHHVQPSDLVCIDDKFHVFLDSRSKAKWIVVMVLVPGRTTREHEVLRKHIEITYPSHDQGKSSNNSSNGSGHSSISYDDSDSETGGSVSEVITVISVPSQNVSVAGDALFLCYIANMSVESRSFFYQKMKHTFGLTFPMKPNEPPSE
ncbi:hypothetical protein YC2023_042987 [Brassica napus]